jgi:hypothetical protein
MRVDDDRQIVNVTKSACRLVRPLDELVLQLPILVKSLLEEQSKGVLVQLEGAVSLL